MFFDKTVFPIFQKTISVYVGEKSKFFSLDLLR